MSTETANKLRSAIAKENSLTKETEYLKKELVGARRSQKDVLRQNVTLLKEIDRLRGRPSYNMQVPDVNDTSAQTMITTELVDVRNYEDVVAINAKQTIALR
ncbi:hypothetical protein SARC_15249 [Sphaeroforma arctica JP610]|uniref:Uncharacterized protein n=1 Tax=Sphaeroforma arctica JP610 TaxID=667725 RepID=A0A0L0F633_9EUKA|nr:hypothetical protein SARC_15249 [Sphaeroforma arctica JP610]KNC72197.1 hypothetical protein SARC_15249 [Sphaeroforma arctica JP610]|eukprot:XP_014146099.1 hypothetical protein SARC_15249 [Sphaeroforma arctica JP610]